MWIPSTNGGYEEKFTGFGVVTGQCALTPPHAPEQQVAVAAQLGPSDGEESAHGVICYLVLIEFNPHCVQAMPRPDNDNTERELIELLTRVLSDFFKEDRHAIAGLSARVALLEENSHIRHLQIMTALETLTESVNANTQGQANLTTAVNAAIVQLGTPGATDAQLLTLAAAIDQNTQSDKSLTDALIAAVNPTPTP